MYRLFRKREYTAMPSQLKRRREDMATATLIRNPVSEVEHAIGNIPNVTKIFASRNGNLVSVWTVVDNFDRSVRNNVYEAEREIFASFPGMKFDFNVVPDSDGLDISSAELVYVR
jgi:hypothetical protein